MVRDGARAPPHHEEADRGYFAWGCFRYFGRERAARRPWGWEGNNLHQPAGSVSPPSPSASCIITVSSQRPNLKPTFGWVPIISNPHLVCTPIDPALAVSPITAIICR